MQSGSLNQDTCFFELPAVSLQGAAEMLVTEQAWDSCRALISECKVLQALADVLNAAAAANVMPDEEKEEHLPLKDGSELVLVAVKLLNQDLYLALEAEIDWSATAIKKSYRKLILKYHPDKSPHTAAVFQIVQAAYEVISSPEARGEYDACYRRCSEVDSDDDEIVVTPSRATQNRSRQILKCEECKTA